MAVSWRVSQQMWRDIKRLTWILFGIMAAILAADWLPAQRAVWLSISSMGTTPMAIMVSLLPILLVFIEAYYRHGWAGVRKNWRLFGKKVYYFTLAFWIVMFVYQFIVNAHVSLDVSLTSQSGYSSASPKAGQESTPDTMQDRQQYLLVLANKTHSVFQVIELRLQLPYPIDENEISASTDTGNVRFDPAGAVFRFEGGSTTFMRTPVTSVYELHIENMRPEGRYNSCLF